jgi:hypothetical protein
VVLTTLAAVIASQAVISGAFLTHSSGGTAHLPATRGHRAHVCHAHVIACSLGSHGTRCEQRDISRFRRVVWWRLGQKSSRELACGTAGRRNDEQPQRIAERAETPAIARRRWPQDERDRSTRHEAELEMKTATGSQCVPGSAVQDPARCGMMGQRLLPVLPRGTAARPGSVRSAVRRCAVPPRCIHGAARRPLGATAFAFPFKYRSNQ